METEKSNVLRLTYRHVIISNTSKFSCYSEKHVLPPYEYAYTPSLTFFLVQVLQR